ncbi:MAG: dimethyl sulfoxide reductase anchor subunit [Burkholderiaceae bacterium]|nr:dimethyl sulfoxide reductase anchor subunit [Burkholderiaceae bacterium]
MSYGPQPWQQTAWDWRAAGNFIGGGAGSGLIMFTALAGADGAAAAALLLAGLALIGLGLACVWAELGRPLRALHVFFNPRTSWMTREAIAATVLFPAGAAAALLAYMGVKGIAWLPAVLAFAFIYCQSRMVQAARGIPAWREPCVVALLLATSLAEGAGLFWLAQPWHRQGSTPLAIVFGALLLVRIVVWYAYRARLDGHAAPRALAALDRAGRVLLLGGTVVPLALLAVALVEGSAAAAAWAGLAAAPAGAFVKFTLITRAGFNQGFALQRLPVRGQTPRATP